MNRLSTRLLLAMLVVSLVSLLAVPVAVSLADRASLATLPEGYRVRLQEAAPAPWILRWWAGPRRPAPRPQPLQQFLGDDAARLHGELERMVAFVGDSRTARRDATAIAVVLAVLVSVALARWSSRSIARPIAAVSDASSQLAAGRFGVQVTLPNRPFQPAETRALTDGFNAMSEAIERYEGERKVMLADVAHELRTPLAAIRLRLEALADGLVPFERAEVELLRHHTDLLARLVDDLRLLSLVDAGRLELATEEVDLGDWLRRTAEALRGGLERRGVRLEVTAPADAVTIRFDPQRMAQVLHNLLDNAARYSPDGAAVEVACQVEGGALRLAVRDRGPGVPDDELDAVFERFVRGRRRDEGGAGGSGLGLAIVRTLVLLHGGRVWARNLPEAAGGGAEFTVELPLSGAAAG